MSSGAAWVTNSATRRSWHALCRNSWTRLRGAELVDRHAHEEEVVVVQRRRRAQLGQLHIAGERLGDGPATFFVLPLTLK